MPFLYNPGCHVNNIPFVTLLSYARLIRVMSAATRIKLTGLKNIEERREPSY